MSKSMDVLDVSKWVVEQFVMAYGEEKTAKNFGVTEKFIEALACHLENFELEDVARGMKLATQQHEEWPPNLIKFVKLCKPLSLADRGYMHEAAALDYCIKMSCGTAYGVKPQHGDVYRCMVSKIGKDVLANKPKNEIWPKFLELYPRAIRWYESGGRIKEEEVKRLPGNVKRVEEFIKEMKEKVGI